MAEQICPLCQASKHMRRTKLLYGTPVCKRCYYKFANRRQLAFIVDWIVWLPIAITLEFSLSEVLAIVQLDPLLAEFVFIGFSWIGFRLLFVCKDCFSGHSPGKWISGVRVVDRDTVEPIGIAGSLKRNLPILIPVMPIVIAFLLQKGYRVGDGWANSKVIWKKYASHPVFTGLYACQHCQFDLTGNVSGVCPECGTPIPERS